MKNKKVKTEKIEKIGITIEEVIEILDELHNYFDDRISDLYQVKGGAAERQIYLFYRSILTDAVEKLEGTYTQK